MNLNYEDPFIYLCKSEQEGRKEKKECSDLVFSHQGWLIWGQPCGRNPRLCWLWLVEAFPTAQMVQAPHNPSTPVRTCYANGGTTGWIKGNRKCHLHDYYQLLRSLTAFLSSLCYQNNRTLESYCFLTWAERDRSHTSLTPNARAG